MTSKKIESHSSNLNNQRIITLLVNVDQCALQASNSMHFETIKSYYNAIEQVFVNVKDVFFEKKSGIDINKTRKQYHFFHDLILSSIEFRNSKTLTMMLRLCRKYNSQLITLMQADLEYFFRIGTREKKGLMNIPFFEEQKVEVDDDVREIETEI